MKLDYEAKFLLNPGVVLGADHKPTVAVHSSFRLKQTPTLMKIQFMDTDTREIYDAGWNVRIQKKLDSDKFEINFKKRNPVPQDNLDDVIMTSNTDGFDMSDPNLEFQLDWGFSKQTLSISRKKKASADGYRSEEAPDGSMSREMATREAPGKIKDWKDDGWGITALHQARVYGPIFAERYSGL